MEEKIVKILLNNLDCEAIVLFGSYSRGTQNAESDIDISIKVKKELDKLSERQVKHIKVFEVAYTEIDLSNVKNNFLNFSVAVYG